MTMATSEAVSTLPLRERRRDWFFVVAFSFFIITSIVTDSVNGLNTSLDPNSSYFIERFIYNTYARIADPLLILNPPQVRWSAFISAFVWLPMYFFFIVGFVKGWNRIRIPGLVYGGALTHGMITYMAEGTLGFMATEGWADPLLCAGCTEPQTWRYLLANLPYLIVPALMIVRMWKPNPFAAPVQEEATAEVLVDLTGTSPMVSIDGVPVRDVKVLTTDNN
jgi:EXPERA (EXPanded EBP superfamily)